VVCGSCLLLLLNILMLFDGYRNFMISMDIGLKYAHFKS
jgi:hypothetical protein